MGSASQLQHGICGQLVWRNDMPATLNFAEKAKLAASGVGRSPLVEQS
jgi:hypothetical protein